MFLDVVPTSSSQALDFVRDVPLDGLRFRALTMIDESRWKFLAIEVDASLTGRTGIRMIRDN